MNKRTCLSSIIFFLFLSSCSIGKPSGSLHAHTNKYDSYDDMVSDLLFFKEKYKKIDSVHSIAFFNPVHIDGLAERYYVGGICYCGLETESQEHESNVNCKSLHNREPVVQYWADNTCVNVSYNTLTVINSETFINLKWVEGKGCKGVYPGPANNDYSDSTPKGYELVNEKSESLIGLNFYPSFPENYKKTVFNLVLESAYLDNLIDINP